MPPDKIPSPDHSHVEIVTLLKENQVLLRENNELLREQDRREKRRFIFKIVWYAVLLGLPLIVYYLVYSMVMGVGGGGELDMGGVSPATIEQLLELYSGQ